eukprot:g69916.t1
MVCKERQAVGLLSEAPDGVQLFGKIYACKFCGVKPDGWPGPGHKNLNSGSGKCCLGHTVFAVALNKQLDNFGAFTTEDIPVGVSTRHRGIFFDGKLCKKQECEHESHLIIVESRHMPKPDHLCVDGFDLIKEYRQVQTNLLGVLWEYPDTQQQGTGSKSVILHLPKHLRYQGSAHLTNSTKCEALGVPASMEGSFGDFHQKWEPKYPQIFEIFYMFFFLTRLNVHSVYVHREAKKQHYWGHSYCVKSGARDVNELMEMTPRTD